jgi:hypothetical protein
VLDLIVMIVELMEELECKYLMIDNMVER